MWTTLFSVVLVINEVMASNAGEVMSPAINFDSWIEVYNPGDADVNLSGMYLSVDPNNPLQWQMPNDIGSVPKGGFKVIWLGSNEIKNNQAPFKLDCDGGTIILSDKNGKLITQQDYPEALSRTAYARKTVDSNEWGWTATPTPGASNETAIFAAKRLEAPVVSVGSRLFQNSFDFEVTIPKDAILMYTTDGSVPTSTTEGSFEPTWLDYVINGDCEGDEATSFVCRDANGDGDYPRITDGVGINGSRGAMVHAIDNPVNDWDAQFFVYTPDHIWQTGDHFRFHMMVRADKEADIIVEAQSIPGSYISSNMLAVNYHIGTTWQEIFYEGTITDEQSGNSVMQTIAFTLNGDHIENNFYFDNISWEVYQSVPTNGSTTAKQSKDGKFTVMGTTNYVFRLFQDGYLPSIPVTRSYIQTYDSYTIPVISIVGNKRYFTDPKIGIDCNGDGTNGKPGNGQDQPRNYNMDWDRPVNFSFLSPDGQMLFNQDVNIAVSGGWTRSVYPRSMKLKANKIFDGQNRFDFSFFPQKPYIRNKQLVLRNGGNDNENGARFMDAALETIIQRSGIDLDCQSYVPIIEYVNGELRGVLNLREPNNDKYAYANFGYDDEELDAFENTEFKNGNDEAYKRLCKLSENVNGPGVYDQIKSLLDVDEFANYMAVEFFIGNDDWPDNNVKAYRSQLGGRFRFVSFDLDYAFNVRGRTISSLLNTYSNGDEKVEMIVLFLNLLKHNGFRKQFIDTFCLVGGSVFEREIACSIVDDLLANVKPMTDLMIQKGLDGGHHPENSANKIKDELNNRLSKMISSLQEVSAMKLSGVNKHNVQLSADTEGANLYINDLLVPYAYFNGQLFDPVKLKAKAPAGYTFTGWKKNATAGYLSTESVIDLPSDDTVSLIACFTPLSEAERTAQGMTPVRINEVSASNSIYVNELFKRNDWLELYNTTDHPIDVAGMYLSDNLQKPAKFQISKGNASTIIPAHGYIIIWCDKLNAISQLHASFKLDADGGDLVLTTADETWKDIFTYTRHEGDQSVGRYPDGTDDVFLMNIPTIEKPNIKTSYLIGVEQPYATITQEPIVLGDLNDDRSVSITDVVLIVDVIAGSITDAKKVKAADVNKDGSVTITDCVAAIDLIAAQSKSVRMNRASQKLISSDYISAFMKDNLLTVNFDNENHYTAFQMVVTMPEGMTLDKAVIDKLRGTDHQLTVRNLGNGKYLVVGYSMDNSELAGNSGRLLSIATNGQANGDIVISDIEFATAEAEAYHLDPVSISSTATGIYQIENREWKQDAVIFDLQGRRVNHPSRGLYIVNGSKLIVK